MDPLVIGGLALLGLLALIAAKVPIGIAMTVAGLVGFGLSVGFEPALSLLTRDPAILFSSVDFATAPLFLLMGAFASAAGLSKDLYGVATAFLGHRRGGLAYATILGSGGFGAVCGSSTATAATFTKIALPEMLQRGYSQSLATGTIAAGGAIKSLIPPSVVMILYCIVAKTYLFDVFIAAIIPALLTITLNYLAITVTVRMNPAAAPVSERIPWPERIELLKRAIPAFSLLLAVFGGLYSGIFTVNEAASVAAILALLFALFRGKLNWTTVSQGLVEAAGVTVMLYVIIFGTSVFSYFMTLERVPDALVMTIGDSHLPPIAIISLLLVTYLILGAIFDELSAIMVTLPFVIPIVIGAGYDPVWWGIMCVIMIEFGLITPPFGLLVFVIHGLARNIRMGTIYRGVVPFLIADAIVLLLLLFFPDIALWLPRVLGK